MNTRINWPLWRINFDLHCARSALGKIVMAAADVRTTRFASCASSRADIWIITCKQRYLHINYTIIYNAGDCASPRRTPCRRCGLARMWYPKEFETLRTNGCLFWSKISLGRCVRRHEIQIKFGKVLVRGLRRTVALAQLCSQRCCSRQLLCKSDVYFGRISNFIKIMIIHCKKFQYSYTISFVRYITIILSNITGSYN